jgi:hypothetical protein
MPAQEGVAGAVHCWHGLKVEDKRHLKSFVVIFVFYWGALYCSIFLLILRSISQKIAIVLVRHVKSVLFPRLHGTWLNYRPSVQLLYSLHFGCKSAKEISSCISSPQMSCELILERRCPILRCAVRLGFLLPSATEAGTVRCWIRAMLHDSWDPCVPLPWIPPLTRLIRKRLIPDATPWWAWAASWSVALLDIFCYLLISLSPRGYMMSWWKLTRKNRRSNQHLNSMSMWYSNTKDCYSYLVGSSALLSTFLFCLC